MRRPKVALFHPQLDLARSPTVSLLTLEALRCDYDVTLITAGKLDVRVLNDGGETGTGSGYVQHRRIPVPSWLRRSGRFGGLQTRYAYRYARQIAPEFDVLLSMGGPMDCGRPCIQRIPDVLFTEETRLEFAPGLRRWRRWWYGSSSPVRRVYLAACDLVARREPEQWRRNLTISNSAWTQAYLQARFGIESRIIYPPVPDDFPQVPFSERESGFVCVGRIAVEKRIDGMIEILAQVRERGHNVHLHILGAALDPAYGKTVERLAEGHREWVFLEGWAVGQKKRDLLTRHRYGIHTGHEAFGVGVAEMGKAGCVVFVSQGGGQEEIVAHPDLIFKDDAEAVQKIDALLGNEKKQVELSAHLAATCERFAPATFKEEMRQAVADFLDSARACLR